MDGLYLQGGGGGGGRKGQGGKGGSILTNDTFAGESQAEEDHSELPLRVTMTSLLALLILSTLVGNTLVCAAVARSRHLRAKVTNVFVVSLAVSDLLVAMLVMPWKAAAEAAGFWPFGRFCDLWLALDITCSTASILNLCVISVDRYWAISRPFAYERTMTRKTALAMVGAAWALSALISFVPVQLRWHRAGPADDPGGRAGANATGTPEESCDSRLNRTYAISSSLVSFYVPVAVMVGTYARIFCIAQRQIRRISSLERAAEHAQGCQSRGCPHEIPSKNSFRKETKVLKTLSIIVGVFVVCWLPFFVLNCVAPFCDRASQELGGLPCVGDTVFDIFVWFGWANSSLNPIIYAFNTDFRKAFASLLGCGGFCPSNAVGAADFTNELVSYHHDTSCQKELATLSYPHLLPRTAAIRGEDDVLGFDKDSQSSSESDAAVFVPTIVNVEDEVDLAHEKIRPFVPHTVD